MKQYRGPRLPGLLISLGWTGEVLARRTIPLDPDLSVFHIVIYEDRGDP